MGGGVEAQGGGFCHKSFAVGIRIKRRVFGEGWRAGAGVGQEGLQTQASVGGVKDRSRGRSLCGVRVEQSGG